jgi:hypothetical protein
MTKVHELAERIAKAFEWNRSDLWTAVYSYTNESITWQEEYDIERAIALIKPMLEEESKEKDVEIERLKKEVQYRDDIIGLSPDGDRHGHLVAEIERLRKLSTDRLVEVEELRAERNEYKAEIERLRNHTYCAYCGEEFAIDIDTAAVSEHIATCQKHPMRGLEAEIERLKTKLDAGESEAASVEDMGRIEKQQAEIERLKEEAAVSNMVPGLASTRLARLLEETDRLGITDPLSPEPPEAKIIAEIERLKEAEEAAGNLADSLDNAGIKLRAEIERLKKRITESEPTTDPYERNEAGDPIRHNLPTEKRNDGE